MNQLRDCSVLGDLAWFEGKPAVNEDWASPFHPLIASGASRLCMLAPSGLRTLIGPAHGAYATLAQVPRYDPVPGPQLARPKLQYGSLRRPVDEPSLFGETTLTCKWGRIGWPGQRRIALYENHTVAMEALETCSSASAVVATS
jgi:hypothetical protein